MNRLLFFTLLLGVTASSSCKIEAQPIDFGNEACHFCSMTIVDRQHAAQFVTQKGKQYKFDAIECMVNEVERSDVDPAVLYVADYATSTMTDALRATYLVSPKIRSPMGANLSGFSSKIEASKSQELHGGTLHTWHDLKAIVEKVN